MSQFAKSLVGAIAAVLIAGVTAWQTVAAGHPFRPVDVLPIAVAVVGAVLTYVVPNVPELPTAKAWVSGLLAVLTALTTALTGHPADLTVANMVVAALGALATWYVPNLEPAAGQLLTAAADAAAGHPDPVEITDALRQLEQLPAVPAPSTPRVPVQAWPPVTPAQVAAEPTPLADAALTAVQAAAPLAPPAPVVVG